MDHAIMRDPAPVHAIRVEGHGDIALVIHQNRTTITAKGRNFVVDDIIRRLGERWCIIVTRMQISWAATVRM